MVEYLPSLSFEKERDSKERLSSLPSGKPVLKRLTVHTDTGANERNTKTAVSGACKNSRSMSGATGSKSHSDDDGHSKSHPETRCHKYLTRIGCKRLANIPHRWPRTFYFIAGVVLPLWFLIGMALFFGYFLCLAESPVEVEKNNAAIATAQSTLQRFFIVGNVTAQLPTLCLDFFLRKNGNQQRNGSIVNDTEDLIDFVTGLVDTPLVSNGPLFDGGIFNGTVRLNITDSLNITDALDLLDDIVNTTEELLEFMYRCGEISRNLSEALTDRTFEAIESGHLPLSLTFNWVRCPNSNKTLFNRTNNLYPNVQAQTAIQAWRESQEALYNQYLAEYLEAGAGPFEALTNAVRQSYSDATGFDDCELNLAASAWFWFVIMTTVGYGNQTTVTVIGRTMVVTLGFLCILAFGAILARSGVIITTIADDFNHRMKLNFLNRPWVGVIYWGALSYSWMLVEAMYTVKWKKYRLGEDFPWNDAYWLAYISTTTIGLGDFYYESTVITLDDLIVLPLMFLTGFVLLSNFIVKCTATVHRLLPQNERSLEEALQATDVFGDDESEDADKGNGEENDNGEEQSDKSVEEAEANTAGAVDALEIEEEHATET